MSWTLIVGVNGVGKDTIAGEAQKLKPDIKLISGSRVFMKAIGLDVDLRADFQVPTEYYQRLDKVDDQLLKEVYDTTFVDILREYKTTHPDVMFLYHLCIVKMNPVDGTVIYDDSFVRDWYYELFDNFVLLESPAETIKLRCELDRSMNRRIRPQLSQEQIEEQIRRSNQEWGKIVAHLNLIKKPSYFVINNTDIQQSVERLVAVLK